MHCIRNWKKFTKDPCVLATVNGYRLPLNSQPYQEHIPQQYHLSPAEHAGLEEQLQKMMFLRAIKRPPQESVKQFVSQHFCNPEVGRSMASRLQFEKPEQLYPDRALQDGVSKSRVRPPLPRLVYVQTRSKGCVPFDSHSSGRSEVAPFSVARSNVAIQVPAIRTIRCATHFHQDPGPCSRVPEIPQHSPCGLPGRLAISRCNSRGCHKIGRRSNVFVGAPGIHHFRRQVNIEASSVPGVLRNSSQFCIYALSSSRPEVHWNQQGLSPYVEQGHCLSLNAAALARQDAGCGQSCSIGAGKVKDATVSAKYAPRRTSESGPVEHCPSRPVMMDSPDSFSAVQTYSDLTAVPDSDNRCIQLWMGCDLQWAL